MDEELEQVRGVYLAELRALAPRLGAWWAAGVARDGEDAFGRRWPTGLAGHPSVLAAFRRAYLAIERLNDERAEDWSPQLPDPLSEDPWGSDAADEKGRPFIRHVEALVDDLEELAPDVFDLVAGLVFVPVGLDDAEAVV